MTSEYIELGSGISKIIDYRGKTPQKLGSDWVDQGVRVVSAKNVHDGKLDNLDAIRCVTDEIYRKWMKDEIQRNDILLASEGASMGESMLWESDEKVVLGQRLFCLRCDNSVLNPYYLAMYMRTPEYRAELVNHATGTSVMGLRQPALLRTKIRYIPIKTQNMIGELYRVILAKIDSNKKINDNLQQQVAALFANFYDHAETEVSFTEIIQILGGGTPKTGESSYWNGNVPFFTPKDVGSPYTLSTEKTITEEGLAHCNSRLYPVNTVFVTARGTVGKVGLPGVPMAMNQSCYALVGKETHQLLVYFYTLKAVDRLKHKASGAVFDAITTRDFESEIIMKLSDEDAQGFLDVAEPIYQAVLSNSIENLRLAALRDSLLPKLMSGEINVSDIQL